MTFEEVLKKYKFARYPAVFDNEWVKGEHPVVGKGVAVLVDEVFRDLDDDSPSAPKTYIFDVCINERGEDDSILEWADSQNMVPEGFEKIATDGAYGAVWDIYGSTPEQLEEVLKKVDFNDRG